MREAATGESGSVPLGASVGNGARGLQPAHRHRYLRRRPLLGHPGEYAKAAPEDVLILIALNNRGPDATTIDVLPTLWFRNTWTWWPELGTPKLSVAGSGCNRVIVAAQSPYGLKNSFSSSTEVPFICRKLSAGMQVEFLQHQVQLRFCEVDVDTRDDH
jgi:hypothetical protein